MHEIKQQQLIDSVDTTSPEQNNIDTELIKLLYQQANAALIGVIATASGIAILFYNEASSLSVVAWLAIIYGLSFIRYITIIKFKSHDRGNGDVSHWGQLFSFFAFLSGLTWGAASVVFFTPDNLQLFNTLTLIIIAMSVGSLAALSAFPTAFYLFVFATMPPMIWRHLSIDVQSYTIFGILLFVFNGAMFSIIRRNHHILRESIKLRFENIELLKQSTEQRKNAEQANIAKTKFLASASHDMRQPIHAMGLFLGILEDRVASEANKSIVHKIQKSNMAMSDLLDSLLDISKLDAGIITVTNKPYFVNDLFEMLKNELEPYASEKGIKVRFVRTRLQLDSDYFIAARIMRNLITNAIKYTNSGGVVVGCRRFKGKTLLAVYDSGVGIHEDDIDVIFDEFHQLGNPERDRSKGLGLGLAIVKRMAKLIGASLYVRSVPDYGSLFAINVSSLVCIYNETEQPLLISGESYFDNKCILVVEDEEGIREALYELIRSWRCVVITAASGDDAVRTIEKERIKPDVILTDYRLRDNETGIDVISKVNSLYSETVPAIIVTGDTDPERIKEAQSGGHSVLHKPVSPNELRALIANTLSQ